MESIAATRLWVKKQFPTVNPFAVRLGFDFNEQYRNVQRYDAQIWTFVGADHRASTQDDNAAQIAAVNVQPARDSYYGSPAVPRISLRRLYDVFKAHPDWFEYRAAESHRFSTTEPYELDEKTYAPYFDFSGAFFHNRLTYLGGVRYEKAKAWGIGNRDNGAASTVGISDPLLAAQRRYVRKGARGQGENDGWFPSLQLNYNFTEKLIWRVGYAKTQAKNRFQRSVIPSTTFDPTPVTTGPYSGIAIGSVNRPNPNLEPWRADNYETHLEYYTAQGGVISAGVFRKDIQDVQVQRTILLDTPQKLADLGLESTFLNFQSTTWINEGVGRIDGAEIEIRQPLDPLLPQLLRGFSFTGSFNYNDLKKFNYSGGNVSTDFQNFYETQYKGSLAYRRGKLSANVGVIENGKVYRQRDDAAGHIGHRYYPPYTTVDFGVEYALTRWAKLFVYGRNVTDAQKMRLRKVEGAPSWSNFHIANNLGVTYTAGVTGSF
jgi:TonB-dependent receptor